MAESIGVLATLACSLFAGAATYINFVEHPARLAAIMPTNNKLLEPGRDNNSQETRRLLETWGRLHAVRSVLSLVATLVYLHALV